MGSHWSIGMFLQKQFIFPDWALTPTDDLLHSKGLQCLQFLMQFCCCNLANFALAKFARVVTK